MKPAATIVRSAGLWRSQEAAAALLPRRYTAASSCRVLTSLHLLCWRGGAAARRSRAAPYWAVAHPTGGGGRQGWPATWRHWSRRTGPSYSAPHQPGAAPRAASRQRLVDSRLVASVGLPCQRRNPSIAAVAGADDCCCSGHLAAAPPTLEGMEQPCSYGIALTQI